MAPHAPEHDQAVGTPAARVLFLAPLPPPANGHSLASKVALDGLSTRATVDVIDLGRSSKHDGQVTLRRLGAVGSALWRTWRHQRRADAIYLTISESLAGNAKDIVIYLLCLGRIDRMVIHVHGGSLGRNLFDRRPWVRRLNGMLLRRMRGVIVTGDAHRGIFDGLVDSARIHVVTNFADDSVFLSEADIRAKFANPEPLRVLYLSGMTALKGYDTLRKAYLALTPAQQRRLQVDFAGSFESAADRQAFESAIAGVEGLTYHGFADAQLRRSLYARAHVFCLPTEHYEGQPLSILEAYASGCAVITTGQPGILDVFSPGTQGWTVEPGSVASLRDALAAVIDAGDRLLPMALANHAEAEVRYRHGRFAEHVAEIVLPVN